MLQHAPLYLGVPKVSDERLQHPQGIEHIALLPFGLLHRLHRMVYPSIV